MIIFFRDYFMSLGFTFSAQRESRNLFLDTSSYLVYMLFWEITSPLQMYSYDQK